jgi:hypothetical protein
VTREHPSTPIIVPGAGSWENRTPSTFHPKETHKAGPRKASKAKRNFRINGADRGASPTVATATKYMRSGGPERRAARIARNLAKQERLRTRGAQRRISTINRRLDRRVLKAAEHLIDALD